ncbi:DUF935 family protein [Fibrisoma montanum]|uniref:DUF935 family protein n=1 Tax=Fibrisoma montanum TaxID=2305895 RepID=A0A418M693_9BACT|nr:DUF935 family protein [Fibrisoma montanum]RIV21384.1 DUF935 family protein [Fibrisoma montanum]
MAKSTTKPKAKNPALTVIDQSLQVRSLDRSKKSLQSWKTALQSAESIVNPVRKLLYDLYADIVLDDQLSSVLDQRRLTLTNSTLTFQKDGEPIDDIQAIIDQECFEDLLVNILDSKFYGYSLSQCDFANGKIELVPRPHVRPEFGIVVANPSDSTGIDYTVAPYDKLCLGVGKKNDLGLLLKAAPLVLLKRGDVSDWATFNEVFGQPLRVGKYDPNIPGNREQVAKGLESMGSMAYGVLPIGSEITFQSTYQTSSADTYERFAKRMDEAISKLIIGQTMTTDKGSSRSQAEVHERVADKIAIADQRFVLRYLNHHVRNMLVAQGFASAANGEFKFVEEEAKLTKKERLEMDLRIHKEVAPLQIDYFAEEYNVPIDEAALQERKEQQEQEPQPPAAKKKAPTGKGKKVEQALDEMSFKRFLNLFRDFFAEAPTR